MKQFSFNQDRGRRNSAIACALVFLSLLFAVTPARAEKPAPFVFAPTNGPGPFPVVLWLHGYRGYSPAGYIPGGNAEAMRKHANTLGAVIVGFPGTIELGDGTQQWSEDPVVDQAYIQERLAEIAKTNNLDLHRVALVGFSQGAKLAADLATLYPETYLGAVIMSPGGFKAQQPAKARKPAHAKQVYFCFCGALEHPGNVELTKYYARYLEQSLGAKVTLKLYPGISKHTRPPDFVEKFPEWVAAILSPGKNPGELK